MENVINLDYIVAKRKKMGFTQEKMAKKLGMNSAPAYNKYEKGVYKFNADIIPLLMSVLQCEFTDIFLPTKLTKQKFDKI